MIWMVVVVVVVVKEVMVIYEFHHFYIIIIIYEYAHHTHKYTVHTRIMNTHKNYMMTRYYCFFIDIINIQYNIYKYMHIVVFIATNIYYLPLL